ncbi:hypothetical protein [Cupriavidus sp. UYPR2.512]|uniref:hypothetical protein n=1 Tax=Cupriavidus sp. UYPR2.512 TaxID=1080187 RepID=UPI0018E004E6|nr:hypothetical protein [Cupriavidus sp. UYPR2.512]
MEDVGAQYLGDGLERVQKAVLPDRRLIEVTDELISWQFHSSPGAGVRASCVPSGRLPLFLFNALSCAGYHCRSASRTAIFFLAFINLNDASQYAFLQNSAKVRRLQIQLPGQENEARINKNHNGVCSI